MFSYEGTRRRQAVTTTALVPTLKERAGDFSGVSAVIVDPFTKIPFPGNVIPAEKINRVGAALANLYPAPNNADSARNYIGHPTVCPITMSWQRELTIGLEAEMRSGSGGCRLRQQ